MNKNDTDGAVEFINISTCHSLFTWSRVIRIAWVNTENWRTKIKTFPNQKRKPKQAQAVCPVCTIAQRPCYSCCTGPSKVRGWNTGIRWRQQGRKRRVKCRSHTSENNHSWLSGVIKTRGIFKKYLMKVQWKFPLCGNANCRLRVEKRVEIFIKSISEILVGIVMLACNITFSLRKIEQEKSLSPFASCAQF